MNPDEDGDLFILNYRWLSYKNQKLNNEEQHYLWSKIGTKVDMTRKGDSNRNELNHKKVSAILTCGKSPRMGHA